jgi:hypothetical protein
LVTANHAELGHKNIATVHLSGRPVAMASPTSGDYLRTHHLVFALTPLPHSNCTEKVAVAEPTFEAHVSPIFGPALATQPVLGS